jgi:hypothetical protein
MADLITIDDYKTARGISSIKEDLKLSPLIPSVSQLVKTYCGNSIVDYYSTNKIEIFNIDWATHVVQLTESPVNTIVSVEKRDSVSESYSTVPSTDYYLDKATDSVLYVTGSTYKNWPLGAGAIKVTYTAGYSTCPADLRLAVIDLITYYLKEEHRETRTLGGASIQNPSSTSLNDNVGFPDHIKRVLDLYKNF